MSAKDVHRALKAQYPKREISIGNITVNKDTIMEIIISSFYKQIFEDGLIHGDPHPANFFMTGDSQITMIDFGIVARISPSQRQMFKELLEAVISNDPSKVADMVVAIDQREGYGDPIKLHNRINELMGSYEGTTSKEFSPTKLLFAIIYETGLLDIQWPRYMVLIAKVLTLIDGQIQVFDPNINMFDEIKKYVAQHEMEHMLDDFDPLALMYKSQKTIRDLIKSGASIPAEFIQILEDVKKDGFPVSVTNNPLIQINDKQQPQEPDIHTSYNLKLKMLGGLIALSVGAVVVLMLFAPTHIVTGGIYINILLGLCGILLLSTIYLIFHEH